MTGEELRTIRLHLGLTQDQLGQILGYGQPQRRISELERGARRIVDRVRRLVIYQIHEAPRFTQEQIKNVLPALEV